MRLCCNGLSRPLACLAAVVLFAHVCVSLTVVPLCNEGDECDSCDIQLTAGSRCKKEAETFELLYCNNKTGLINADDSAFLRCVWPRQKLRRENCPKQSYFSAKHGECIDVTIRKYRQAYTTGSSRLGDPCVQNTDCIDYLMYCSSGICACTSSAVQINDVCYKKVEPSGTGCSYNEQCTSYWPSTTCVSGTCTCPAGYHTGFVRDGNVCVRDGGAPASNTNTYCPLPDLSTLAVTGTSSYYINSLTPLFVNTGNALSTCTLAAGCSANVNSLLGTSNVAVPVTDLYDCVQTTGGVQTSGICCPSRGLTCAQPVATGGPSTGQGTQRYYYDSVAGVCDQFTYYKDGSTVENTNGNNFATRDHCVTYCEDTCERGPPQYTTGSTDPRNLSPLGCTATSDTCDSDHNCDRIGSNYICCNEPEYNCGLYGGRGTYTTVPTVADSGFHPRGGTATTTRYFFNPATGTCQTFQYLYGGGNFNNFGSENDCENYCYQELCTYGNPLKTTTGANQRCSSDSDCPTSYQCTSGTGATSIQICCPRTQTICEQAKVIGTCTNWVRRYWHNPSTGECEQFQYSGCGGNDNNFKLQIDCQTACRDTTAQPQCIQGLAYKDSYGKYYTCTSSGVGTTQCPANYQCYFDGFMWGCCPQKAYTCSLSSDSGRTCGAAVSRWYYDTSNLRCISYTYYGCDGNPNNFPSKSLCETYCGVGGCPNGGQAYREDNTGYLRVCSGAVTCPAGYECDTVNEGGSTVSRCCPTKATICSTPPTQGQSCGSINTERYYFNRVTRDCTTFTYQGCESTGNNFGTMAQCQNYCSSAACGAGEVVYLDPNTQRPRTCNQQLTNACPTGYTCRYDSLTQNSVCCGATNEGVCTANEKAYIEALTMDPRECMPNIASTCPNQYQCRYNTRRGKYYCCAPIDGSICPSSRAAYFDTNTRSPITCTISSIVNSCPTGYTCQTVVPNSFSGYCCTAGTVCPQGVPYDKNSFNNPVQCNIGGIAVCRSGYSCQTTTSGSTAGYCCEGTGQAENAGCPPNQFVQKDPAGNIPTCNPFTIGQSGCSTGNTCQWSNTRNQYQCCGNNPQTFVAVGSNGCPSSQTAFLESNGQARICPSVVSTVCPTGYFCQYSTERSIIQCCGVRDGCPAGRVAFIGSTGSAQQCTQQFGGCPTGFECILGSNGHQICCTASNSSDNNNQGSACGPNQISFNGQCLNRANVNERCTVSEQCPSGVACINFRCQRNQQTTCAPGQVSVNGQCLPLAQINQPCQSSAQCQGGSTCQAGSCRCAADQTNVNGQCQRVNTQAPVNLADYCLSGFTPFTDNGTPRSCSGNSFSCPNGAQCQYSLAQRDYFCCSPGSAQSNQPGVQGCRSGRPFVYQPTNTPLVCSPGVNNCPPGYECQANQASNDGTYQCCGGSRARSAQADEPNQQQGSGDREATHEGFNCAANKVLVISRTHGNTVARCASSCPPGERNVQGVCRPDQFVMRDDPFTDIGPIDKFIAEDLSELEFS